MVLWLGIVASAVSLSLEEHDQVAPDQIALVVATLRSVIENETGSPVIERPPGLVDARTSAESIEIHVRLFGGPIHIHVALERNGGAVVSSTDLPNEKSEAWKDLLLRPVREMLEGWRRPPKIASKMDLEPPPPSTRSLAPLVLVSAGGAATTGALVFALLAKNARSGLEADGYTAAGFDARYATLRRDETIAEVCLGAALVGTAVAFAWWLFDR